MNGKKILIVDFDEKSVDPLSKYLEEEGYQILVAKDGESGLEMCKSELPNLVILEPMLPKLHGFELCSIITKDIEPKIPVVILTKFYKEQQFKIESTRSFGASAFLSKPFNKAELKSHLSDLIFGSADIEQGKAEEAEIPNSLPVETLQNLEENLEKEEVKVQKNQQLEQEIFKMDPLEKPKAVKPVNSGNISQEIDAMLQDTLSDFGMNKLDTKPSLKVEKKEVSKPVAVPSPEDKMTSALEELKSEVNIEAKITPIEIPSVEESAAKVEDELIQQFEANIAAAKSQPPVEKKDTKVKDIEPSIEEKQEVEETVTLEVDVAEKETPTALEKEIDPESFFSEYSALEEKPSFFKKLLNKIKRTPPKLLVPIVAAFVVLTIAVVFMLRPNKADNNPVQQSSLGVLSIQKTVEDPPLSEGQESTPAENEVLTSAVDPDNPQTEDTSAQTEAEVIQEPEQKPRPIPKNTPPPFQPLTAAEGEEATIDPQIVGEVAITQAEETSTEDTSQSSQPAAPPANLVQTGDLVPIQQVDEVPIVLKRVLPEY
ncbi:MAG: response regulator, partial [Candidatus Aminicenantes bacterium]|nr:response regulator [Candidatus Aminicenantes bacterium]